MTRESRCDITEPGRAVRLFRDWCLTKGIVPECATLHDLQHFGYFLLEGGYPLDEVEQCKYVVFSHL